jgi:hypothetical protein
MIFRLKIIIIGRHFVRKSKEAALECERQVQAHKEYEDALQAGDVRQWKEEMEAWEADTTKPNPFSIRVESKPLLILQSVSLTLFASFIS